MRGKFENYTICKNIWDDYCEYNSAQGKSLCHYTDTSVLDSVLEHGVFWASNIRFMNDFGEYEWGAKIISKTQEKVDYKDLKWFAKKLFSISFTSDNDSLHQWLTYAKESGVCIEIDSNLIYNQDGENGIYYFEQETVNSMGNIEDGMIPFRYEVSKILRPVFYQEPTYTVEIDHVLSYSIVAAYAKNPAFSIEKESRAVFYAVSDNSKFGKARFSVIRYNHKNNGILRPYMKITILRKVKDTYEICIPIKSIIVGPSGIQQTIYDSVVHRCKYGIMKVHKYERQDLCNRLNYIFTSAINEWEDLQTNIETEGKFLIKKYLLRKWYDEYYDQEEIFKVVSCMYWDTNAKIIYDDKEQVNELEKVLSWIDKNQDDTNELNKYDIALRALKEILCDNFVTAEGIWIKKSKIPYLYS